MVLFLCCFKHGDCVTTTAPMLLPLVVLVFFAPALFAWLQHCRGDEVGALVPTCRSSWLGRGAGW